MSYLYIEEIIIKKYFSVMFTAIFVIGLVVAQDADRSVNNDSENEQDARKHSMVMYSYE